MTTKKLFASAARIALLHCALIALVACHHGDGYDAPTTVPTSFTIGGTVSGLNGTLVLQNSGGADLSVTANGAYAFSGTFASGSAYVITVKTQPSTPSQTCVVANGNGTVNAANVSNVVVTCTTNAYSVSGTISGLSGTVILKNNASNDLSIANNGGFSFANSIASGSNYNVTVFTQPASPAQTCTIANGAGLIASANVTNVVVTCSVNLYSIGYTVTGLTGSGLVLQNNANDNAAVTNSGSYLFATSIASGQGYSVSVLQQPTNPVQSCVVANGSGTVVNANITAPLVTCATPAGQFPNFAYVTNAEDDNVAAYSINPTTGELSPIPGSPFAAGSYPISIAIGNGSKFVYVLNRDWGNASVYAINPTTGALTPIPGSPFATGTDPYSITLDPSGKFAYVAHLGSRTVSAYSIDAITGALTTVTGSPYATGTTPLFVGVDRQSRFAYVSNANSDNISAYTINSNTGSLTPMIGSPFAIGTSPNFITGDRTGNFAYVANRDDDSVSVYAIHQSTGVLTPTLTSFAAGDRPNSIVLEQSGKFAYVANYSSDNISAYAIEASTGALTEVNGSPFAAGSNPVSGVVNTSGKFVYMVNYLSHDISAFTIDPISGALTAMPGSPFAAGERPSSIAVTKFQY